MAELREIVGGGVEPDPGGSLQSQINALSLRTDKNSGFNPWKLPYSMAAINDLFPPTPGFYFAGIPTASSPTTGAQSGTTVTLSGGTFVFKPEDKGRVISWGNGVEAVITGWTSSTVVTVDRSQTVSAAVFTLQAKGFRIAGMGDLTGYPFPLLVEQWYRSFGYGGAWVSAISDKTQGRYTATVVSSSAVLTLSNAYTYAPAGYAYQVPIGESVEFFIPNDYVSTFPDADYPFNERQGARLTNRATFVYRPEAGAAFKVERKRAEDLLWTEVAASVSAATAPEDLGYVSYDHTLSPGWHYRFTTLSSTSGSMSFIGCLLENKATPGFIYVAWSWTTATSIANYNTLTPSALRALMQVLKLDMLFHQFRDYPSEVPDLQSALNAMRTLWVDNYGRFDWVLVGGYENSTDTVAAENNEYRTFAGANPNLVTYIDQTAVTPTYAIADSAGLMQSAVLSSIKGESTYASFINEVLHLDSHPFVREGRDVSSHRIDADILTVSGSNVFDALRDGRSGPWTNKITASSNTYSGWSGNQVAPGTAGFTAQMWIDLPSGDVAGSGILLFCINTSAFSNPLTGTISAVIDTSERLVVSIRNTANTGVLEYRFANFVARYGNQRGCLTIQFNTTLDHPIVYWGVERVNDYCSLTENFSGTGTPDRIETPVNIPGTFVGFGMDLRCPWRAGAYWSGVVLSDAEIRLNARSGRVVGLTAPSAKWVANIPGRTVKDTSGNTGRDIILRNVGASAAYDSGDMTTTGLLWEDIRGPRTTYEMTSTTLGAILRQGEDTVANTASLLTATLPANPVTPGPTVRVVGKGAGKWKIAQPAGVQIVTAAGGTVGTNATTVGTGGSVTAANQYDTLELEPIGGGVWVIVGTAPAGLVFV